MRNYFRDYRAPASNPGRDGRRFDGINSSDSRDIPIENNDDPVNFIIRTSINICRVNYASVNYAEFQVIEISVYVLPRVGNSPNLAAEDTVAL